MSRLSAIVTLSADATTFGDIQAFLEQAQALGIDPATELLDGSHTQLEGISGDIAGCRSEPGHATLADLQEWVRQVLALGATPESVVAVGGDTLAVDLTVVSVEPIGCGDCVGEAPQDDILVNLHAHPDLEDL